MSSLPKKFWGNDLFRFLYTLILTLILPLLFVRLAWRSLLIPAYRERWLERLGVFNNSAESNGIWIHAVSVGEVIAITPFIRLILKNNKNLPIVITTTTPTGSDQVRRSFGKEIFNVYIPYDIPWAISRFLNKLKPKFFLMVETEIWPNLLLECKKREIKTILANARLSEKSLNKYMIFGNFIKNTFSKIDYVAAQSIEDFDRFLKIGVNERNISVTGSIKFDIDIPASIEEQAEAMRRSWMGRPVWIAASTHDGEEEIILNAHKILLKKYSNALLVLVPRHPDRFDKVAFLIKRYKFDFVRRSTGKPIDTAKVYLADTMGELNILLGASDVAFIGGSLSMNGGHNMLEAAAQGIPTCFGPNTYNFSLISDILLNCGAAKKVENIETLSQLLSLWLGDASIRSLAGESGRKVVDQNKGALKKLYKQVERLINFSN